MSELYPVQRLATSGQALHGPPASTAASGHLSVEGGQSACFPGTRQRSMSFDQQQANNVEFERRYSLAEGEGCSVGVSRGPGRTDQPMDLRVLSTRARRLEILPGGIVSQPVQAFVTRDPREPHPVGILPMAGGLQGISHGGHPISKQFATDSHETMMNTCMTYGQSALTDGGAQDPQSLSMAAPLGTSQSHLHSTNPMNSLSLGAPMASNSGMSPLVIPKQEYVPPSEDRETPQGQPSMQQNLHSTPHNGKLRFIGRKSRYYIYSFNEISLFLRFNDEY